MTDKTISLFPLLTLLLTLTSLPAAADWHRATTIQETNNAFWLGAGGKLYNYKEALPVTVISDSERGWMPSVTAGASMMSNSGWYLAADVTAEWGPLTYRGAYLITPTTLLVSTTDEEIYEIHGQIGKGYRLGSHAMVTPYLELGLRDWRRGLSATQVENYNHYSTMAGVMFQYSPASRLVFTTYASAGTTLGAVMELNNVKYQLTETGIYKAGLRINYRMTKDYDFFTSVEAQHFRYGRSPEQPDTSYEPGSFTNEVTSRVGFAYRFN